jgi:hypothetical protein
MVRNSMVSEAASRVHREPDNIDRNHVAFGRAADCKGDLTVKNRVCGL